MATATIVNERIEALRDRCRREIDEGLLPSCSAAIGLGGDIVWSEAFGDATTDTRYVIYSCTKGLIAGVVWQLIGEGALSVDDRVIDHFEEFGENGKTEITVEQLLAHTAGFPRAPMNAKQWDDRATRVQVMSAWRLNWEPGTQFEYHPTSAHWVLREIIERVEGDEIGSILQRRITGPLGLASTALCVPPSRQSGIAELVAVGEFPSPDELMAVFGVPTYDLGEVTPEAIVEFNEPEVLSIGVPGGGAVATASDLALYYQGLLHNPGGLWDATELADGTGHVRNMYPDPILGCAAWRTAGLTVAGDDGQAFLRGFGRTASPRAFGHNGAAGQIAFADPDTGLSVGYCTNGVDRHFLRQSRRTTAVASRAAVVTTPE